MWVFSSSSSSLHARQKGSTLPLQVYRPECPRTAPVLQDGALVESGATLTETLGCAPRWIAERREGTSYHVVSNDFSDCCLGTCRGCPSCLGGPYSHRGALDNGWSRWHGKLSHGRKPVPFHGHWIRYWSSRGYFHLFMACSATSASHKPVTGSCSTHEIRPPSWRWSSCARGGMARWSSLHAKISNLVSDRRSCLYRVHLAVRTIPAV